jgi:hypothetical protein
VRPAAGRSGRRRGALRLGIAAALLAAGCTAGAGAPAEPGGQGPAGPAPATSAAPAASLVAAAEAPGTREAPPRFRGSVSVIDRSTRSRMRWSWRPACPVGLRDLRLLRVDHYRADDDRSMVADNTSAFNCRRVAGTSRWSEHAYGRAIDVNRVQNPYVAGGHVSPSAGRSYADRARRAPGMIHAGDVVVRAFAAAGWRWGGAWRGARDYQHFSASGR